MALWDEPLATLIRLQAAYMERHGQSVEWDPGRTERLLAALERLTQTGQDNGNGGNPTG